MEVYDLLGRRVALLHDGIATGALTLSLDASTLAPGTYVVRRASGASVETARFVVQ